MLHEPVGIRGRGAGTEITDQLGGEEVLVTPGLSAGIVHQRTEEEPVSEGREGARRGARGSGTQVVDIGRGGAVPADQLGPDVQRWRGAKTKLRAEGREEGRRPAAGIEQVEHLNRRIDAIVAPELAVVPRSAEKIERPLPDREVGWLDSSLPGTFVAGERPS